MKRIIIPFHYTIPYHKDGEIEIGVSGDYDPRLNYQRYDTLVFSTGEYVLDEIRFKDVRSRDGSFDAYATLQHRFGGFTLKGGLRTEYEIYNLLILNSPANNVHKGYWGLYPSLHLSYRTKNMHNFKLSYTRRVNNPDGNDLCTFIEYGEDNYSTGNPDLRQTFTNSIEAGWTKYINESKRNVQQRPSLIRRKQAPSFEIGLEPHLVHQVISGSVFWQKFLGVRFDIVVHLFATIGIHDIEHIPFSNLIRRAILIVPLFVRNLINANYEHLCLNLLRIAKHDDVLGIK